MLVRLNSLHSHMLVAMLPPLHLHPDVVNLRKGIYVVRLQAEWHAAQSLDNGHASQSSVEASQSLSNFL